MDISRLPAVLAMDAAIAINGARALVQRPQNPQKIGSGNASATGTTFTVTQPTGTTAGCGVMVAVWTQGGTLPATPAGWQLLGSATFAGSTNSLAIYSHIVGIAEAQNAVTWPFTYAASSTYRALWLVYSIDPTIAPVITFGQDASGTTQTAPAVTFAQQGAAVWTVVACRNAGGGTISTPTAVPFWNKVVEGSGISMLTTTMGGNTSSGVEALTSSVTDIGVTASIAWPMLNGGRKFANSFQTGLSAFSVSTQMGPVAPVVIADPTTPGASRSVCQFDVLAGQERQELATGGPQHYVPFFNGDDLWFWNAYWLDPLFPLLAKPDNFQVMHQFKTDLTSSATGPSVGMTLGAFATPAWVVSAAGFPTANGGSAEAHTVGPMTRGVWTQFIHHITFSTDPTKSVVQIWMSVDGAPFTEAFDSNNKVQETINTIVTEMRPGWWPSFANETAGSQGGTFRIGCVAGYEKHGIYRDPAATADAHMYSAGCRWGGSLYEVLGQPYGS